MRLLQRWRLRLRSLLRRGQVERELGDELRFHLDQLIEEKIAEGMTPPEARRAALRSFGGVAQVAEECRDRRRLGAVDDLLRDVQQAVRGFRRAPGFTLATVLTLSVGLAATTAIFSVAYGVMWKPLPFAQPERLVGVWHGPLNHGPGTYLTYRAGQRVFEGLGAWEASQVSITGGGEPEQVEALAVSAEALPLLRVAPHRGRGFEAADERPGSPRRVLLSFGYWQRKFGGAEDVIGRRLQLAGTPAEIIGVLPPSFRFLRTNPALLLPLQIDPADAAVGIFDFQVFGRLRPGVSVAQANADLDRLLPLLPPAYQRHRLQVNVRPLLDDVSREVRPVLSILLATVGIVLLIACANVANLFLVRAESRGPELAVRAALGASRRRIARQLLTESALLGLAAGVLGTVIAGVSLVILREHAPLSLPRVEDIGLHPPVLLVTLAASLVSGVGFGLLPVLRLRAAEPAALKETNRAATTSPRRQRARKGLVIGEMALAVVLLVSAGLMVRTVMFLRQVPPGFRAPHHVQTLRVDVPQGLIPDPEQMARTHQEIARRLAEVPGVMGVGMASSITMDGEDNTNPIFVEHVHAPYQQLPPFRRFKSLAPGYFTAMGNPLMAGRDVTWADVFSRAPVVIISARLAREHWGSPQQALGKRIGRPQEWRQIIGVSGDERDDGLGRPATAIVYWPLLDPEYGERTMAYAVRSARVGSPGFVSELRQAIWSVNPQLPLAQVRTLADIQSAAMAQTAFATVMFGIAASVALVLGLVGLYAVIAQVVAQRQREVCIRMALGAQVGNVRALFLAQGTRLTAAGIAVGILLSLPLGRLMSSLLFGVTSTDLTTYVVVSLVLGTVALGATWLPVRRAARLDPMAVLRRV